VHKVIKQSLSEEMEKDRVVGEGEGIEWPSWGMEKLEQDLNASMDTKHGHVEEVEVEAAPVVVEKMVVDEKNKVDEEMIAADKSKVEVEMVVAKKRKVSEEDKNGEVEVILARALSISLYCESCIIPPVCNMCGLVGNISVFRCWGCWLPVSKDLRHCDECGKPMVTRKFWCKDCLTMYGVTKCGLCFVCGRPGGGRRELGGWRSSSKISMPLCVL
jgi:hypothetical protein